MASTVQAIKVEVVDVHSIVSTFTFQPPWPSSKCILISTDCHGILLYCHAARTQELPTKQESLSVLLNDKSLDQELKATWREGPDS